MPYKDKQEQKHVVDSRVTYLVTSLMEEVMRSGTAAGVRARYGFKCPRRGQDRYFLG